MAPMIRGSLTDWAASISYFKAVLENIEVGVVLIEGEERRIVLANSAISRILGVEASQLLGSPRGRLVQLLVALSDDPHRVVETVGAVPVNGAYDEVGDFTIDRPTRRVIRWSAKPVPIPAGIGQLCLFQDVTAQVELTEQYLRDAQTDPLTGLLNRRGGDSALRREIDRAHRSKKPLSVAMFDLDAFKAINDTHGHLAGDAALRTVATTLTQTMRACDTAVRIGGDEMLVILPYIGVEGARAFAQRACLRVAEESRMGGHPITISAGVAELEPAGSRDVTALLASADRSLYEAKRAAR